jgi:cytosine/adenosine deaminase-related metal-dependent hydrolase
MKRVEALIPADEAGEEVEKYNGILTPGFINAHCHVE